MREYAIAVVVLCHNQAVYLPACLAALDVELATPLGQVQVILVDDGSEDGSVALLDRWRASHPDIPLITNAEPVGNCKAFNKALALVQAPYLIDLAADDILPPGSIAARLQSFEGAGKGAAYSHGNAVYIDDAGKTMFTYHKPGADYSSWKGDVFEQLFLGRFICPSSVTFETQSLRAIGGYDEQLSYEDFDAWMRLARDGKVAYTTAIVSQHRVHTRSMSARSYGDRAKQTLASTLVICTKAFALARTSAERKAIARFTRYHLRMALYMGCREEAISFEDLLKSEKLHSSSTSAWVVLAKAQLPLDGVYRIYRRLMDAW